MFVKILSVILLVSANSAYSTEADDGCLMDNSAIGKPAIYSSKEFLRSKWDDKNKIAIFLTENNETLTIKYSACENFGVDAELSADITNENVLRQDAISNRIKWLTQKVIGKANETKFVEKYVKGKLFSQFFIDGIYNKKEMVFDIPSKDYSEVVMRVEISKGILIISLSTVSPG